MMQTGFLQAQHFQTFQCAQFQAVTRISGWDKHEKQFFDQPADEQKRNCKK
jgi:hypothetical protein